MKNRPAVRKFVAPENAQIHGAAVQAFQKSISAEEIMPTFNRVMKRYGYESGEIDTDGWYPLQMYYDICEDLKSASGDTLILVSIGMKVIESAQFPPEINSINTAIQLLMDTHHLNLKNVPDYDGYHSIEVEDDKISFVEQTSFPHNVMYGYIYALAHRYAPKGIIPIVQREYLNPEDEDADGAHYIITWME